MVMETHIRRRPLKNDGQEGERCGNDAHIGRGNERETDLGNSPVEPFRGQSRTTRA